MDTHTTDGRRRAHCGYKIAFKLPNELSATFSGSMAEKEKTSGMRQDFRAQSVVKAKPLSVQSERFHKWLVLENRVISEKGLECESTRWCLKLQLLRMKSSP